MTEECPTAAAGRSGLKLPEISLGLWQNFGEGTGRLTFSGRSSCERSTWRHSFRPRKQLWCALWLRPSPTSARSCAPTCGLPGRADHSTRPAGTCGPARTASGVRASTCWPAWIRRWPDGPGVRRHLLHHRPDPKTPLEETMGALDTAVRRQGAVRRDLLLRGPSGPPRPSAILLRRWARLLLIHQPSYSILDRWIEDGLLDVLGREDMGCIAFSALAQGVLTGKYLDGVPWARGRAWTARCRGADRRRSGWPGARR